MTNDALTPYERWMVKSNLVRIHDEGLDATAVVARLRSGGYWRVASGVEAAIASLAQTCEDRGYKCCIDYPDAQYAREHGIDVDGWPRGLPLRGTNYASWYVEHVARWEGNQ